MTGSPEDNPHFKTELTPGELGMFAKLERDQAVLNEIGSNLAAFRDGIVTSRNIFVQELCKKYGVKNPAKVTFDPKTKRLVSVFSAELAAVKIDRRPPAFEETAARLVLGAIRELTAIFKAAHEAESTKGSSHGG